MRCWTPGRRQSLHRESHSDDELQAAAVRPGAGGQSGSGGGQVSTSPGET
jgi:hypothetical protein